MNLLEAEQGLTIARPPVEAPGTIVEFMQEGYAIEKDPAPVATMFIPVSPAEATLVASQQPETDTAVVGKDKDTVLALIAADNVIRPSSLQESTFETEKPEKAAEKNGFGNNALKALRRSKLGMYAVTAITAAGAFFAAHTESAKAEKQPVGSVIALSSIRFLDETSTSPVPITPLPSEPSEGDTSDAPEPEPVPTDPKELKQNCTDVALQKPKIIEAIVQHAGKFEPEPEQRFSLTTQYEKRMPKYCNGLYSQGNKARAQVRHDGQWMNATRWHGIDVPQQYTDRGNWYDLGNELGIDFAICRARIMLQATVVDLSVDTGKSWPPHPIVAKRAFPPIPAKLLPHKPKDC